MKLIALAVIFLGSTLGTLGWAMLSVDYATPGKNYAIWLMLIHSFSAAFALAVFWVRYLTERNRI